MHLRAARLLMRRLDNWPSRFKFCVTSTRLLSGLGSARRDGTSASVGSQLWGCEGNDQLEWFEWQRVWKSATRVVSV